jgi:very-short-patch-repair endonuclease
MADRRNPIDAVIAPIAARQRGLVTRAQMLEGGVSAAAIDARLKAGTLRAVYRGVYLVGPVVPADMAELAAVLACGPTAVLSHRSAAVRWGLLPGPTRDVPVDVAVRRGRGCRVTGIRSHRLPALRPDEVTEHDGMPVTTPSRTILDVAHELGRRDLERVVAGAERLELLDRAELRRLIAVHPRRPGVAALRSLLTDRAPAALTRSEAEERFLGLVRRAQLPTPETNVPIGIYRVDVLWRRERVVVEVDGFAFHRSRGRFEGDRRRDARLLADGYRVVRVTWEQMEHEPEAMLVRLGRILARPGGAPGSR